MMIKTFMLYNRNDNIQGRTIKNMRVFSMRVSQVTTQRDNRVCNT